MKCLLCLSLPPGSTIVPLSTVLALPPLAGEVLLMPLETMLVHCCWGLSCYCCHQALVWRLSLF